MGNLIQELINLGYLKTPRIIEAFQKIDRAHFVSAKYTDLTYINEPLPIGHGQTISQPLTVAFMLELLQPEEGNKILDIGSGSGWQTALLAHIVGEKGKVYAMEVVPELKEYGEKNVSKYNFVKEGRVEFFAQSAEEGLPEKAPFDRIIAAASCEKIPESWKEQLVIGGRMVVPVKNSIVLLTKDKENHIIEKEFHGFAFVPFITKG